MTNRVLSGATAAVSLVVSEPDLATALGSGDVPVLGTPRVVALCEAATVAALDGALEPGATSVGTRVECDHLAPSRLGDEVRASATLVAVEGRRLEFSVTVTDLAGSTLARSRIERVIVDRARFLDR